MKRKSIFTFCAIALMLVLSLSVLTACNKDGKHNFAEEWSNDETHHWHACADKDCKEIKDKAEHSWNGGNVTVEPTTEKEGAMVYTCTVCRREARYNPLRQAQARRLPLRPIPPKTVLFLQAGMKARTAAKRFPTQHSVFHICRQEFSHFTQNGRLPTLRARRSKKLTQSSSGSPKPSSKRFSRKWK